MLIAAVLLVILVTMIGFGSAVAFSVARLQANIHDEYMPPFAISNAGLEAHAALSRLHNAMLKIILTSDPATIQILEKEMLTLDESLRKNFSIVRSEFPGNAEKITETERLFDEWQNIRAQLITLAQQGHRDQALKLATAVSVQIYSLLETDMDYVVIQAQRHVETLIADAQIRAAAIVRLVWWFLAGLIVSGVFLGVIVIRKVGTILEHDKQTMLMLHESEERMKLALSGADEATWDLNIPTGELNFDIQWGEILGFVSDSEKPHCLEDWARLIHKDDKERVLKALQDHIEGWTSEYKAEYRISSRSGALKWVLGQGCASRC